MDKDNNGVTVNPEGVLMLTLVSFPFCLITGVLTAVFIILMMSEETWVRWLILAISIFSGLTFLFALFYCLLSISAIRYLKRIGTKCEPQK
jgi:amino acid transporter